MKQLKAITDVVAQAMQEKATAKITICLHEGGVRDVSIDKKVKLGEIKA